jgi:Protein of unknown function (DUF4013)
MLNMTQLQTILFYPFRDGAARKNFLIASALMLGNFIIPILPMLMLMGYVARIMRQIIDEKREPSMPEWDDWNTFLTDGLRMWGFRMVIMLPLLVLMFGGMGLYFIFLILGTSQSNSHTTSPLIFAGLLVFLIVMAIFMILAIPVGVVSMVGSAHVVAKKSFSAGFAFREWWQIFLKNIGTFIIYYLITMAVSFVLLFVLQILYISIIFICLVPFIFPMVIAYMFLIQDALFAQAYTQGRDMLTAAESNASKSVAESA